MHVGEKVQGVSKSECLGLGLRGLWYQSISEAFPDKSKSWTVAKTKGMISRDIDEEFRFWLQFSIVKWQLGIEPRVFLSSGSIFHGVLWKASNEVNIIHTNSASSTLDTALRYCECWKYHEEIFGSSSDAKCFGTYYIPPFSYPLSIIPSQTWNSIPVSVDISDLTKMLSMKTLTAGALHTTELL